MRRACLRIEFLFAHHQFVVASVLYQDGQVLGASQLLGDQRYTLGALQRRSLSRDTFGIAYGFALREEEGHIFTTPGVAYLGDLFPKKGVPVIDVEHGGSGVALAETLAKVVAEIEPLFVTTSSPSPV